MNTLLVANRKGGVGKTLIAVTIASALASRGARVAIADADRQRSALAWLALRPESAVKIRGLDWTQPGEIGTHPKKLDWLVIDAPGALKEARAEKLIAEARAVIAPVQPGIFDEDATRAFLDEIEEIKRIRKGKVPVHLIVNRARPRAKATRALERFLAELGREPLASLPDRAAYPDLAAKGLSIFDAGGKAMQALRDGWAPVLAELDRDH